MCLKKIEAILYRKKKSKQTAESKRSQVNKKQGNIIQQNKSKNKKQNECRRSFA